MHHSVKSFIERNIDHIEQRNWSLVWDSWYNTAEEDYFLPQFMSILVSTGCATEEELLATRRTFLRAVIEQLFNNKTLGDRIRFSDVPFLIYSMLYLDVNDVFYIFNDIACTNGYQRMNETWVRK